MGCFKDWLVAYSKRCHLIKYCCRDLDGTPDWNGELTPLFSDKPQPAGELEEKKEELIHHNKRTEKSEDADRLELEKISIENRLRKQFEERLSVEKKEIEDRMNSEKKELEERLNAEKQILEDKLVELETSHGKLPQELADKVEEIQQLKK
eukprot:TRINITY_DN7698_c0_g1_i3.p1 TRINITY_DN7698_c0_g1~~TRINITY_DN7698_c0_g1_i3.p1  ORF type:complete len:151 (-),score=54.18 TRINITY_DN7698_c0_g1_i3:118-570(-)